ncbi:MAG: sulfur oxidation c-type cytochrome SoxX [Acidiferrobacter sp.]
MGKGITTRTVRLVVLGLGLALAPGAWAWGRAPTAAECRAHPVNPVTRGGCIVIDRKTGNCAACHVIPGTRMDGNIGPSFAHFHRLFPDRRIVRARTVKLALFNQIYNPTVLNPHTAMPPFGKDGILTKTEIREVVDFLWTL